MKFALFTICLLIAAAKPIAAQNGQISDVLNTLLSSVSNLGGISITPQPGVDFSSILQPLVNTIDGLLKTIRTGLGSDSVKNNRKIQKAFENASVTLEDMETRLNSIIGNLTTCVEVAVPKCQGIVVDLIHFTKDLFVLKLALEIMIFESLKLNGNGGAKGAVDNVLGSLGNVLGDSFAAVSGIGGSMSGPIGPILGTVGAQLGPAIATVTDLLATSTKTAGAVNSMASMFGPIGGVLNPASTMVADLGEQVVTIINDAITRTLAQIADAVKNLNLGGGGSGASNNQANSAVTMPSTTMSA